VNDDSTLDMFDDVLTRIKGVGACVSLEFNFLGGKKSHVEQLKKDADTGVSSMYNTLIESDYYSGHVKEFWRTIESSTELVPKAKKSSHD
jgi:hypothetical protein